MAAYLESFPVPPEDQPLVGLPPPDSDFPSISEAWGATPMLRIALTAKGTEVEMDPTPDELLDSMLEMMDDMSNKVRQPTSQTLHINLKAFETLSIIISQRSSGRHVH